MQTLMELYDAMCEGKVDKWDEVPVFANQGAEHEFGVWSWNEQYAIVGESRDVLSVRPYKLEDGRVVVDWDADPLTKKG